MTTKRIAISGQALIDGEPGELSLEGTFVTEKKPPPPTEPPPPIPPPGGGWPVDVTLRPLDIGAKWVTFGLPLPPGALHDASLVRVTIADKTVPAFVKSLGSWVRWPAPELVAETPWQEHGSPGLRSVLIQFPWTFTTSEDVDVVVALGEAPEKRLKEGVDPQSTYRPVNDVGQLYTGKEGYMEPSVLALIDHQWLASTGIGVMTGLSDQTAELKAMDDAERNFFFTAIADYRTDWRRTASDWPVDPVEGPDLSGAEDGCWLYQRAQTFFQVYVRSGMPEALRSAYQAFAHYRTLIYDDKSCEAETNKSWCRGFFRLKNPVPGKPYKDPKYSYAEDFLTYYWLTGDATVLPYLNWIADAQDLGVPNVGWTERFAAYHLQAHTIRYELTNDEKSLAKARAIVDGLVERCEKPNSEGNATGIWIGNTEWGEDGDGFSPWMSGFLMTQLARYYAASDDDRVPRMLVSAAQVIALRGMGRTKAIENTEMLVPFYGARTSGVVQDADGSNPWAGIEHSVNVAQSLAIGYLFSEVPEQRDMLRGVIGSLLKSAEWSYRYWHRAAPMRPAWRLSPWRKYNWQHRAAGQIQWALYGRPTL